MKLLLLFLVGLVPIFGQQVQQLSVKEKGKLLEEKRPEIFEQKTREFYLKNPITTKERECFQKLKPGFSVDFVIDVAPSPSLDEVDKRCTYSPVGLFLQHVVRERLTPSKVYFDTIAMFIDTVAFGVEPKLTHSIIVDKGRKFYLRGRGIEEVELNKEGTDFFDLQRNLKTMWPVPTSSKPEETPVKPIIGNNLGRMTKLALWNRDNGVPSVLFGSKRSKDVYTILISDGSSDSKITDLVSDLSRTTVIDVGDNRFVSKLSWDEMKRCVNVVSLPAPQVLPVMIPTVRNMLCWLIENKMQ